jgi:hypothetical protein
VPAILKNVSTTDRPKVLVVENPDADPDILTSGDVEIVEASTYPISGFIPDVELAEMDPLHYAKLAENFPPDSVPHKLLLSYQKEFEGHLSSRGIEPESVSDPLH